MSMMLETSNMCRVCSSAGLYDIHSPIPFYLHSNVNEFSFWTKSIKVLMEEVTGFEISKDDGLPQKICTICISYLKHAASFRQQVLTNSNQLRNSALKATNLQLGASPHPVTSEKFYPINETNVNKVAYENLKAELDLFFEDNNDLDTDDDSDDDQSNDVNEYNPNRFTKMDTTKTAIQNFFNYSEKIFEEDVLSGFDRIEINQPDDYKERKCHACKCRFMLQESYESHMKDCIQAKLVSFITDCHQLLIVKKHKAVSTAEFMRRMIFSLKNIVKSLALSYRVITKKQPIKDTNPDVVRTENTFQGFDQRLFRATEDIAVTNKLPPPLKSMKPPSPSAVPFRDRNVKILPKTVATSTPKPQTSFAAKCTICQILFNGIDELEKHNRQAHNSSRERSSSASSNRSFVHANGAMLLDEEDYLHEGIVDVFKLRRRSPNVVNIELNSNH
ncbi:hypothetical protein HA402_008320 [Bradysia odoriphaga]|nr:hypothetical protein HA402_008320 [Bradysia odoriphaga]